MAIGLGITLLLYLQRPTAENRQERTLGLDTAQTQRPAPVIHPADTPIYNINATPPQKTNTLPPSEQPSVIADPKPSREAPLRELSVQEETVHDFGYPAPHLPAESRALRQSNYTG